MPRKIKGKTVVKKFSVCKPNINGCGGAFYFLGFVGALVYYLSTATSLWTGFLGVIKALLWPAFVVFGLMKFLGI